MRASSNDDTHATEMSPMRKYPVNDVVSGVKYPGHAQLKSTTTMAGNAPMTHICMRPSAVFVRMTPSRRFISRSVCAVVSSTFGRFPPT